jgi:anti-sigma regulatory factor (Ser/Thr protein kinase)
MEVTAQLRIEVADSSGSGQARRAAADLARGLAFDAHDAGRVALVVTELATNLVKHAQGGELLLHALETRDRTGIAILSLDRGPGISDARAAVQDGYSTTGTPGTGLGAVRRKASRFDLYSSPGTGCAVLAEVWSGDRSPDAAICVGGLNVPFPGESVSGDAWCVACDGPRTSALLVDGLGHGVLAADAARAALAAFDAHPQLAPPDRLAEIHSGLRSTRGAAAVIAEVDRSRRLLRFAGIGNISAQIATEGASRHLVSHHGTAGHHAPRIQEFQYPWSAESSLILHTDGLGSRWTLKDYPGLMRRHPGLIAGVLYRDLRRGRDDASIVVLREAT